MRVGAPVLVKIAQALKMIVGVLAIAETKTQGHRRTGTTTIGMMMIGTMMTGVAANMIGLMMAGATAAKIHRKTRENMEGMMTVGTAVVSLQ